MTIAFRRQYIAKAFFGLDFSDTQSSSLDSNSRPPPFLPGSSSYHLIADDQRYQFETCASGLPIEIRLQIYHLHLVSRFDREKNPSWAIGNTC